MKVCVCPREAKELEEYERLLIVTSPRVGMQGIRANCGKRQRLELNGRTYLLLWRGRGVLLRIFFFWGGGVPGSSDPDPISDQKM